MKIVENGRNMVILASSGRAYHSGIQAIHKVNCCSNLIVRQQKHEPRSEGIYLLN